MSLFFLVFLLLVSSDTKHNEVTKIVEALYQGNKWGLRYCKGALKILLNLTPFSNNDSESLLTQESSVAPIL